MRITREYRIFVLNKNPIVYTEYCQDGHYNKTEQFDIGQFQTVFEAIKSNFFTVDIAKKKNGEWIVIELGDGQVAEYLGNIESNQFYKSISNIL